MAIKKILFVMPLGEFYGGGERSGFEFCKFLIKQGYDVITAIPKTSKSYKKALDDSRMDYHLLDFTEHEMRSMMGNVRFYNVVHKISQIIREDEIDLLITNLYAQTGPVAAILSNIPNISMDRGQSYINDEHSRFMVPFSDHIVVNSMGLSDIYKKKYNIDTPVIYSYTEKPPVGLNVDIEEQRLVCVSRIAPEKNIEDTFKALKILKDKKIFSGKILLIGPIMSQEYREKLDLLAEECNIQDDIEWLGNQKNPWNLVGQNDIYLNTSEKESVGRSTIEAIKLGVPVVISDIPGHKDIFKEIGALKYKLGDEVDLAKKIKSLIDNPTTTKKSAEKSRMNAEALINEFDCNKNILPLIDKLKKESGAKIGDVLEYLLATSNEYEKIIVNQNKNINNLSGVIVDLNTKIASYQSIKKALKLLVGNVKKRVRVKS